MGTTSIRTNCSLMKTRMQWKAVPSVIASLAAATLLPVACSGQMHVFSGSTSYGALNNSAVIVLANQQVNNASGGLIMGGYASSPSASLNTNHAIIQPLAAGLDTYLTYGVPDRVVLDRFLLASAVQRQIGYWVDYQDNISTIYANQPSIRDQLNQLAQDQINHLQTVSDQLTYSCPVVSFKGYNTEVHADVQYKDLLTGVALIPTYTDGYADLRTINYSEVEGTTKATKRIYRK